MGFGEGSGGALGGGRGRVGESWGQIEVGRNVEGEGTGVN